VSIRATNGELRAVGGVLCHRNELDIWSFIQLHSWRDHNRTPARLNRTTRAMAARRLTKRQWAVQFETLCQQERALWASVEAVTASFPELEHDFERCTACVRSEAQTLRAGIEKLASHRRAPIPVESEGKLSLAVEFETTLHQFRRDAKAALLSIEQELAEAERVPDDGKAQGRSVPPEAPETPEAPRAVLEGTPPSSAPSMGSASRLEDIADSVRRSDRAVHSAQMRLQQATRGWSSTELGLVESLARQFLNSHDASDRGALEAFLLAREERTLPGRDVDECEQAAWWQVRVIRANATKHDLVAEYSRLKAETSAAQQALQVRLELEARAKEEEEARREAAAAAVLEAERRRLERNQLTAWRAERRKEQEDQEAEWRAKERAEAARERRERQVRLERRTRQLDTVAVAPPPLEAPAEDGAAPERSAVSLRERSQRALESASRRRAAVERKKQEKEAAALRALGMVARCEEGLSVGVPAAPVSARRNGARVRRVTLASRARTVSQTEVVKRAVERHEQPAHSATVASTKGAFGSSVRKGIDYTFGGPTRARAAASWCGTAFS
jgi:hypothetical protein